MNKLKVSIIVPIYNQQDFLDDCLLSLVSQNLNEEEYEIICVNDGSTDNSESVCLKYLEKYKNIIYLKQENKGLSSARNTGLNAAQGEYIWFIDSDDRIQENCLCQLIDELCSKDLDLMELLFQRYDNGTDIKNGAINHLNFKKISIHINVFAWSKIIKRKILIDNNVYFLYGISCFEDYIWNLKLTHHILRSERCNQVVYFYRVNPNSITNNKNASENYIIHNFKLFELIKSKQTYIPNDDLQLIIKKVLWVLLISKFSIQEQKRIIEYFIIYGFYPYKFTKGNLNFPYMKTSVKLKLVETFKLVIIEFLSFGFQNQQILFALFHIFKTLRKTDQIGSEYMSEINEIHERISFYI